MTVASSDETTSRSATAPSASPATPEHSTAGYGWQSRTGVCHLDLNCSGLDRMREAGFDPASKLAALTLSDVLSKLTASRDFRLCRLCAVAPMLTALLTVDPDGPKVFATFLNRRPPAQASAARRGRSVRSTEDEQHIIARADDAAERLREAAQAAGLAVTYTSWGPAAYGMVPRVSMDVLRRTVHTEVRETVTWVPAERLVATFWSLLAAQPVVPAPRGADPDPADVAGHDPWFVAELICDPAAS